MLYRRRLPRWEHQVTRLSRQAPDGRSGWLWCEDKTHREWCWKRKRTRKER